MGIGSLAKVTRELEKEEEMGRGDSIGCVV